MTAGSDITPGGSVSTAAAGLRAGIPVVGVPMLSDQPFWAARLAALGAGLRPIRYKRLSIPALTAAIQEVSTRPSYRNQHKPWPPGWPVKTARRWSPARLST
jgi:UDP:flavonoid glycosyltransferase YjiC (YdhE family)